MIDRYKNIIDFRLVESNDDNDNNDRIMYHKMNKIDNEVYHPNLERGE